MRRPGSDGEHALQRRLGTVHRAERFYDEQVLDRLNDRMREFVGRQEMFFLATSDRHGECDSTFRAGPPGFLRVFDDKTLAYPEYRGNGVLASLGNIEENPHLGILLIDFMRDRIGLHINGRARVVADAEMRAAHPDLPVDPVPGRRAVVWVEVTVEEAYIHCAKHIPHLQKVPNQRRQSVPAGGPGTGADAGTRTDAGTGTGSGTGSGTGDGDGTGSVNGAPADRDRDWGTDDVKRKGGDFFGAAADVREGRRTPVVGREQEQEQDDAAARGPVPSRPEEWQREAERVLARARERAPEGAGQPFSGWFR
ncbi:pyridoxamine 5'-phosphate oxidase family protein [Streptomyces sparsogenes]|uniref:pyridoxamine 5'-phosphate oxidase family protein n=1 Tax=Streptomyces sparsogenes TaxID=67365 RepID=UPI003405D2BE